MSRRREDDEGGQLAAAVENLMAEAVRATLEERSPEPVQSCVRHLLAMDERASSDESHPVQLIATLTLLRWTRLVRLELGDRADDPAEDIGVVDIERALAWTEEALGQRYRVRAAYVSGAIRNEETMAESMAYRRALRDQFLPALLWLITGTVAVHGAGDVGWLGRLGQPAGAR